MNPLRISELILVWLVFANIVLLGTTFKIQRAYLRFYLPYLFGLLLAFYAWAHPWHHDGNGLVEAFGLILMWGSIGLQSAAVILRLMWIFATVVWNKMSRSADDNAAAAEDG